MFCCFESKQKAGESYERLVPVFFCNTPVLGNPPKKLFGRYIFFIYIYIYVFFCKKHVVYLSRWVWPSRSHQEVSAKAAERSKKRGANTEISLISIEVMCQLLYYQYLIVNI